MLGLWLFQDCQNPRVLNFQGYTRFIYFRYATWHNCGKILNITGFQLCQVSANAINCSKFCICLVKGSHDFEHAKIWNMARLWICEGCTGCQICLNKPEYALIMLQYVRIWCWNAWIHLSCIYFLQPRVIWKRAHT